MLGLDTVREKTLYQTRFLRERGYRVTVFTAHRDTGSHRDDPSATVIALEAGVLRRVWQVLHYLVSRRSEIHHAELYVGGRFAFVHALITRLAGIPLLVIERGDLLLVQKRAYPWLTRLSIRLCYRLATRVWYRELYMERGLQALGVKDSFLLPNAVPLEDAPASTHTRDIDFLWLNRFIPERRPDQFARGLARVARARPLTAAVVGLSIDPPAPRVAEMERQAGQSLAGVPGCTLEPFSAAPSDYYRRARFFVLHGEIVFANFALLEAMSHGVVPIVSGVEGAERIVTDGENGLVYEPDEDGLVAALLRALDTAPEEWARWSASARETVAADYSLATWGSRLVDAYAKLRP